MTDPNVRPDNSLQPSKLIVFKNKPLGAVTQESLDAIAQANRPPTLFQQNGTLVRIRPYDDGVFPEPLSLDAMRHHLGRSANFVRKYAARSAGGDDKVVIDIPPIEFVRDLMACPDWDEGVFPKLKGVVKCPYFTAGAKLVEEPGYDAGSQLWYEPDPGFNPSKVPADPAAEDVAEARRWIVSELLHDFPFQSEADRTNAVAYLLTPFVREMIDGPVPLALFEAAVAGTGKGLLANAVAIPSSGATLEAIPQRDSGEEWRKAFTAKLIEFPTFILLDNLTGTLRAPALEAILTTERWSDRVLGETRMVRLKLRTVWMATANNLQLGGDLPRRVVWVRLDAKMERPEERKQEAFKHPDLVRWAKANRPELVRSALVLIQNWVARGRPAGNEVMGSYESWTATLGGILAAAGFIDFLKNVQERRRDGDEDLEELKRLVLAWLRAFEFDKVTVKELFGEVAPSELPSYVMAADDVSTQRKRLGNYLRRVEDKVVGQYQVVRMPNLNRDGVRKYRIVDLKAQAAAQSDQSPATRPSSEQLDKLFDQISSPGQHHPTAAATSEVVHETGETAGDFEVADEDGGELDELDA